MSQDKHLALIPCFQESHSNSGGIEEMQQLCYTTPKCLGMLLKLIKSLACLLREIQLNPALKSQLAKHHGMPQGLSHKFPLCPTHNQTILRRFIPEGYKEIPPDLLGAWEERTTFPLGCSNCVSCQTHFTAVQTCRAWAGLQRGHDCCVKGQRASEALLISSPSEALFRGFL